MTKPDLLRDISRENSELAMKGKTKTQGCDYHITRGVNEISQILILLHLKILNLLRHYATQAFHHGVSTWK